MPLPSYYYSTPSLNVSINGINIGEGMARADMNNALRQMMADIKAWTDAYAVAVPISIANGGTGQTTANAGFNALAAAGGTVTGTLKQASKGAYPFWGSTSMTGGQMYIQAIGSDPTTNPGDIVFEY